MKNTSTSAELKYAIQLLEAEQIVKQERLIKQFTITYESLNPFNFLKNSLKDELTSSNIIDTIVAALVGEASGYLTKKITVGTSHNFIRKFIGSIMQFAINKVVSSHPETVKSIGQFLYEHLFNIKDSTNTEQ